MCPHEHHRYILNCKTRVEGITSFKRCECASSFPGSHNRHSILCIALKHLKKNKNILHILAVVCLLFQSFTFYSWHLKTKTPLGTHPQRFEISWCTQFLARSLNGKELLQKKFSYMDPDLHQNRINSSLLHTQPVHVLSESVHNFLRYPVHTKDSQTDKQERRCAEHDTYEIKIRKLPWKQQFGNFEKNWHFKCFTWLNIVHNKFRWYLF